METAQDYAIKYLASVQNNIVIFKFDKFSKNSTFLYKSSILEKMVFT